MKIAKARKKRIDIADSGALSDLAFLLIVFFIIIAVFHVNKGFILELPRRDSRTVMHIDDLIRVNLLGDGRLLLGDSMADLEELEESILKLTAIEPNATVLLHIEPATEYQLVVDVIDIIRRSRVENFSFAMREYTVMDASQ